MAYENLKKYAIRKSLGRKFEEKDLDEKRTPFQKDQNRILHSKAFRRMDAKTQVFTAGSGDHYRTRLTHSLEVAQISRDLARRLGLNEDLCEVIALAHDLGHPPFGHGGEDALDEILKKYGMHFEHNEQSRKTVEEIEKSYPDFDGLNLTFEVLDGLIKHQTVFDQSGKVFETASHLEAQVVNIADEIAYTNHDLDDGIRGGFLKISELKKKTLWKIAEKNVYKKYGEIKDKDVFVSRITSNILSMMVDDLCLQTEKNIKSEKIKTLDDIKFHKGMIVKFSDEMSKNIKELRKYLLEKFYMNLKIFREVQKGKKMIKKVFEFYIKNLKKFPGKKSKNKNDIIIDIKDYIAGMTDFFLADVFEKISKNH
ncbi:dNTP triphosphohydrolase [Candidatus Gracilibacteria bacterium]|nr:dNTP triphosphohydrolase [Candidatus Gracilibacteria bacterium]